MQLTRPVNAEANQEVVLLEKGGPAIIDFGAIGLDSVQDGLPGLFVLFGILHREFKEFKAHQGRLTALPGHGNFRPPAVAFQQLPDVGFQQFIVHPETTAGIERSFGQKKAILAVEVADGPGWFGQKVKERRRSFGNV